MVIHDDMIDGGLIRRKRPCWHTLDDVGLHAVNDYIMIIHIAYFLLKNHCQNLPCYSRLFEYISEGVFFTHIGQTLEKFNTIENCSFETMRKAHLAKTSHFLFYTPISILMALTGYVCSFVFFLLNKSWKYIIIFFSNQGVTIANQSNTFVMKWVTFINAKMVKKNEIFL